MSRDYPYFDEINCRNYRWEDGIKVYEPDRIFTGKTQEKKQDTSPEPQRGLCPFRNHHSRCSNRCSLYHGDGCMIAARPADRETKGMNCPFSAITCTNTCATYNQGCTVIAHIERGINEHF